MAEIKVPTWAPSDDAVVPFTCAGCRIPFSDYPATIVIDTPVDSLRYCSDDCADADGWAQVVQLRWEQEANGRGLYIRYCVPSFEGG